MKTPAAVFLGVEEELMEVLADMSCGAESEPRKNLGEPETAACRRAVRSLGTVGEVKL